MWKFIFLLGSSTLILGLSNKRITGGAETDIQHHKYVVTVLLNGRYWCGGALLSEYWVVTNAQCTNGLEANRFNLRAGTAFHNAGGQMNWVTEIIQHFAYNPETLDFDISLLHLRNPVEDLNAAPIGLAKTPPRAGTMATVLGWGATSENGFHAANIHSVQLPIVSNSNCEIAFEAAELEVTDRMLCAGILGITGRGVCEGDTGGPATVDGVLVGLVSWNIGCGRAEYPGVFMNIAAVQEWITLNTGL